MSHSIVWLNGKLVGGWPYGYASYQLDLTPYLTTGKNTLAIRLNNPTDSSRWYPGGGIYRNVWLLKTHPIHFAHWGTQITTPEVSASSAKICIATQLVNPKEDKVTIGSTIYQAGPDGKKTGKPIATVRFSVHQAADPAGTLNATLELKNPLLWSNEKPNLYIAVTEARLGSVIVDQEEITFGIHSIEFNADKGFLLNGKRVDIPFATRLIEKAHRSSQVTRAPQACGTINSRQ
jgi:beta-galactosidase